MKFLTKPLFGMIETIFDAQKQVYHITDTLPHYPPTTLFSGIVTELIGQW